MERYNKPNDREVIDVNKREKIEPVVQGSVKTKKKSGLSKIADQFISEDAPDVKNYIWVDILVPAVKKAISDMVRNGIDMILYGESRSSGNYQGGYYPYPNSISYVDYRSRNSRNRTPYDEPQRPVRYSPNMIAYDNRGQAEIVLRRLEEIIEVYGSARVADLYDLAGIDNNRNFTDNDYGWDDLRGVKPTRLNNGQWTLNLPRVIPLD